MGSDNYGSVSTLAQNDLFEIIEKFGDHDAQYAMLLSACIALAKVIEIDEDQLHLDVNANWARVPTPDVMQEH